MLEVGVYALVVNRFVEGFIKPIFDKYNLDKFWLMYISWIFAGALVFLTNANLFADSMPNYQLVGQILTAMFAGGGANIISDILPVKK